MLELAVLGLLHDAPMHGYELRKQLHARLGSFRGFSWGSLYPTLRRLQRAGLISETMPETAAERHDATVDAARAARSFRRRGRRVYEITADGKDRLEELLADVGPQAWDDEGFGVHLAFFARTPVDVRVRILEGRRRCVEERREGLLTRTGHQIDRYTRELHRLGLESTEREVRWLNELLAHERAEAAGLDAPAPADGGEPIADIGHPPGARSGHTTRDPDARHPGRDGEAHP